MNIMDKMMDMTVGKMSKEEKEEMMHKVMDRFLAEMTTEDKMKMISKMAPKMMEGVNMHGMMPKMMMSRMMGGGMCKGPMMGIPLMNNEGTEKGMEILPRGISMMLSRVPKEKRADLAIKMISTLIEQVTEGMSKAEKKDFIEKIKKSCR
jgi:uncharacterized protein YaaW (UPF0174 family)